MASLYVCAVRDSAVQAFARPIFVPAIGLAVRSFTDEVNRKSADNSLNQHPEDFELFVLCSFVEESGVFEPIEGGKRCLARGKDVINQE